MSIVIFTAFLRGSVMDGETVFLHVTQKYGTSITVLISEFCNGSIGILIFTEGSLGLRLRLLK